MQFEYGSGDKLAWTTPSRVELTTRATEAGASKFTTETPATASFPGCHPTTPAS
jgi:hypothetical protein